MRSGDGGKLIRNRGRTGEGSSASRASPRHRSPISDLRWVDVQRTAMRWKPECKCRCTPRMRARVRVFTGDGGGGGGGGGGVMVACGGACTVLREIQSHRVLNVQVSAWDLADLFEDKNLAPVCRMVHCGPTLQVRLVYVDVANARCPALSRVRVARVVRVCAGVCSANLGNHVAHVLRPDRLSERVGIFLKLGAVAPRLDAGTCRRSAPRANPQKVESSANK